MERINPFAFYDIAKTLGAVAATRGDTRPIDAVFELVQARYALSNLLDGKPMPVGISRGPATKLLAGINSILSEHCSTNGEDGSPAPMWPDESAPAIPAWRWDYLRRLLDTFETVFSEEMREATAYFVPRRGIFFTPVLVDAADETFPEEVSSCIPAKTREEWKSAGRCLAFSLLSASGFHVARAVEGTMEAYYQFFSSKPGDTLKS